MNNREKFITAVALLDGQETEKSAAVLNMLRSLGRKLPQNLSQKLVGSKPWQWLAHSPNNPNRLKHLGEGLDMATLLGAGGMAGSMYGQYQGRSRGAADAVEMGMNKYNEFYNQSGLGPMVRRLFMPDSQTLYQRVADNLPQSVRKHLY